jgi:hypothetical protein
MMGKLYEVAAALYFGLNPDDDIRWDRHPDTGSDLFVSVRGFDVKGTCHPRGRLLVWPNSKTHLFEGKNFWGLMLVWANSPRSPLFGRCEIRGWCKKEDFLNNKTEVTGTNKYGLYLGTWYVDQDYLRPMHELLSLTEAA